MDPEQSVEDSTKKIEKKSNEKGTGRMPWLQEAMKDVASCDKPRGVCKLTLIRGFPNGETHLFIGIFN